MLSDLGIVDTKKIIAAINDVYSIDFSDMALTSFKRRLIKIMNENSFLYIEDFIKTIEHNSQLFEKCLAEIFVDTTEMFRDPSMWRELRDTYLPDLFRLHHNINIHIPEISSGDEVYSLVILLKESGWWNRVKLLVSSMSQIRLEKLQAGAIYDLKKMEISDANSKRLSESLDLSRYYTIQSGKCVMEKSLLDEVEFRNYSCLKDEELITGQHLILYRNKVIYYNTTLQDRVVIKLMNSLALGGYLCFGVKENIGDSFFASKLQCVNPAEKVYKKRVE